MFLSFKEVLKASWWNKSCVFLVQSGRMICSSKKGGS